MNSTKGNLVFLVGSLAFVSDVDVNGVNLVCGEAVRGCVLAGQKAAECLEDKDAFGLRDNCVVVSFKLPRAGTCAGEYACVIVKQLEEGDHEGEDCRKELCPGL